MIKITIKQGNITEEDVDALVTPTNTQGIMNGSVASSIKEVGGAMIEVNSIRLAPIALGSGIITDSGMMKTPNIIHIPTMVNPGDAADNLSIKKAIIAAMDISEKNNYKIIAIPGMGTGFGEYEPIDAARIIIKEIIKYKNTSLKEIILVDISEIMVTAFKDALRD